MNFEWDETKNILNQQKHGVPFEDAQYAFADNNRIIAIDKEQAMRGRNDIFALVK